MSEKQLNFLNIFETASKKEEQSLPEPESLIEEDDKNDDEDPVAFDLQEKRLREEAELISRKEREKKEAELKKYERQRLLAVHSSLLPSDFQSVLPEIQQYAERVRSYRALYEGSSSERKSELYPRLVWPDSYDEPEYRESARLYVNYLEAIKREADIVKSENQYQGPALKKKKEKPSPTKKQERIRRPLVEVDMHGDEDSPNPYGDIYPYSRNWRP